MKARISRSLTVFSFGAAVALACAGVSAQIPSPAQAHEHGEADHADMMGGDPAQMRAKMHEMMHGMMVHMTAMASHADERLAALKTELKITDAQVPLWNGFADAIRSVAKAAQTEQGEHHQEAKAKPAVVKVVYGGERSYPDAAAIKKTAPAPTSNEAAQSAPAPQSEAAEGLLSRLEAHEKHMSEHLAKLQAIKSALAPLYASFSEEQKKIADGLMVGPFGVL
ncbi:Spy/CpxP family protein refolding chaperone [Methylocapsa acidiphila]|uniref:Spy/CpxP family protein refolding chaperone n=1 Tax=Methylocapsa acidiphila TaxID=133552 RepID=UPI000422503F|nr:Spy/CpxP family protein refolding chaperone [Methylocapsa acidiphila]